jgi:hypothetical protein
MKKHILPLLFSIFFCFQNVSQAQVNVNATVQINGFRHNWDCGNDGAGGDDPDPRYKVWIGRDGANFVQSTSGPGFFTGCGAPEYTYGADAIPCNTWNPGTITAANFTNVSMSQINVDMQSWEEDGCGTECQPNSCTFNSDDTRCGRLRIGDIDFWQQPPCANNTYTGQFTSGNFLSMHNRCGDNNGAGYGINQLIINWSFASSPTITAEPTPLDRTLCIGNSTTLTVGVNTWNGWSLARIVQWQVSTNTDCATPGTWTDIPGANSLSYVPPQTPGTRLYRCIISSHCSDINQQQVISQCVRVTYHPYGAPIISAVCGSSAVPGVPIQFCTTLPPNPNASVNNTSYTWTVSPAAGVTISNPTGSCTNITFTNQVTHTVTLTYGDACAAADATASCTVTVSPPACDMIYVDASVGNDANLGYPNAPVATLRRAMQLVSGSRTNIRMAAGTYTEPRIIRLQNNVVIDGRWQNAAGIWTKNSSLNTTINFTTSDTTIAANNAFKCGFLAQSANNWVLQDLIITTANASGNSTDGRGRNNYGVLIQSCTGYSIVRCNITSGNASNGLAGANGAAGANGGAGGNGNGATCSANDNSSKAGGTGGAGGTNAWGNNGGNGGNGGNTTGGSGANAGNSGANAPVGGALGGNGGSVGSGSGNCITNSLAGNGLPGGGDTTTVVNTLGINGGVATSADTYGAYYISSGQGLQGGHGNPGAGGGGGGGARGQNGSFISCISNSGNSGGGGGGGGGGGQGGFGGWSGGGSFAIYRDNSGITAAPFINIILNNGTAGNGGAGGTGGNGGTGGGGGLGNSTCSNERGTGGNGGAGGDGARGGTGQTGAPGVAGKLYTTTVGFTDPSTSIPNPTTLTMQPRLNGKGCVNSEYELTRSAASTWTLPGANYINDINNVTSSYNASTNTVRVYYTANGEYDITTNGATYEDWVRIIDNTRPGAVTITVNPSPVCSGSNFTVSAPAWGTELEWEWVLYTSNANTPVATSTTQTGSFTAPVVATPTTYNIRYRVRENCCGWSIPYYTAVTVNPPPTLGTLSNNYVCQGNTFSITGLTGSNYNTLTWTTNGDGSFNNTSILNPDYTHGPNDVVNGNVTLTATVTPLAGCNGNLTASMTLTVRPTGQWLGLFNTPVNDNWNNAGNWCGGIPTPTTNAVIPTTPVGPFWPIIGANNANVQDLTLQNATTLTWYQTNTLEVYRDFYNYGATINSNQGLTRFVGSTYNGNIGGSSATTFYNMEVNKTGGTTMNITANQQVLNNLNMQQGDIVVQNPSMLILGTSPLSTGTLTWNATNQPTILGWFRRWFGATTNSGNATSLFPVGNTQGSQVYNRWLLLEYTSAPTTGGHLTTRFVGTPAPFYNGLPLNDAGQLLQNFANEGYWEVNPGGGLAGGQYTLTLRANNFTTINTLSAVRIIKSFSPHTIWSLDGTHGSIVGSIPDFTISRVGMANFSWFTIASDNANPLPVQLLNFQALCKDGAVTLQWATATEINNDYFVVEKSNNGDTWAQVEIQPGGGNSNSIRYYQSVDTKPFNGVSYYRLRQVDYNGDQEHFGPVSVTCIGLNNTDYALIYPNPTNGEFIIELNAGNAYGDGVIEIMDMLGRKVVVRNINVQKGNNIFTFKDEQLRAGTYHISLQLNGISLPVQKLVVK